MPEALVPHRSRKVKREAPPQSKSGKVQSPLCWATGRDEPPQSCALANYPRLPTPTWCAAISDVDEYVISFVELT
ncbi:hypothetical protein EVAR_51943_1 [Eumeta japonica]|uniref:Uncharacterized protein n=1 Tax=Eumeta variegata TaxID=151549 RepID=A0A4C1YK46_EUMVA|nr:hypothetical protein EVAR_51943_1 [Eumeta japonica]